MGTRLFVGNLAHGITEADLREVFARSGEVSEVKLVLDRETGRPRGFGFVEMATPDAATQALEALDGHELEGRDLTVRQAMPRSEGGRGSAANWGTGGSKRGW
jgi:RNA recognition motif-containing protein